MQSDFLMGPGGSPRRLNFLECCIALALFVIAAASSFQLMHQLRDILKPLVLGGFLVAAIERVVDRTYDVLSGRLSSCCLRREKTRTDSASSVDETNPLVPERQGEKRKTVTVEEIVEVQSAGCMRVLAIMLVLFAVGMVFFGLGMVVFYSGMHMKAEWEAYKSGALRAAHSIESAIVHILQQLHVPQDDIDKYIKTSYKRLIDGTASILLNLLNDLLADISNCLSWMLLTFLYVFFWLLRPLPLTSKMNEFIRSYIMKKTIICAGYGLCVGLLFFMLDIDLAAVFGLVSFILNYLPEVGSLLSMILPTPVILLDGRLQQPFATLFAALAGQLLLKFFFANYLETMLIESDQMMNLHPIWILLGLTYFGFVWGPIGMLLSVPILAMIKVAALPENGLMPKPYGFAILSCLEGRQYRKDEIC